MRGRGCACLGRRGACVAGVRVAEETTTAVDGTHPTGMYSS